MNYLKYLSNSFFLSHKIYKIVEICLAKMKKDDILESNSLLL